MSDMLASWLTEKERDEGFSGEKTLGVWEGGREPDTTVKLGSNILKGRDSPIRALHCVMLAYKNAFSRILGFG